MDEQRDREIFSQQRLESSMLTAALLMISDSSMTIDPDCQELLRTFLQSGMQRMATSASSDSEADVRTANDNLRIFVTWMVNDATKDGHSTLHESTFRRAIVALCPLWPFC